MAVLTIPTYSDPFYSQVTSFEGTDYLLRFAYNQRENCWYLSFYDTDENVIVEGLKLVANWPLIRRLENAALPPGELMAVSSTTDDSPPGLEELGEGKRVELTYFTAEELT